MIRILPLDFVGQGAFLEPVDKPLHDAAVDFCQRELAEEVNFAKLSKIWVGLKDDQVFGISGYVLRPDIPLLRAVDADVLRALGHRMNDFFADNGWRKGQTFLYIGDERPEQRCPEWRKVLKEFGAVNAQRFAVEVR